MAATKKKQFSIKKQGVHFELLLDDKLEIKNKRSKYLFSSRGAAKRYFMEIIKPQIRNRA